MFVCKEMFKFTFALQHNEWWWSTACVGWLSATVACCMLIISLALVHFLSCLSDVRLTASLALVHFLSCLSDVHLTTSLALVNFLSCLSNVRLSTVLCLIDLLVTIIYVVIFNWFTFDWYILISGVLMFVYDSWNDFMYIYLFDNIYTNEIKNYPVAQYIGFVEPNPLRTHDI